MTNIVAGMASSHAYAFLDPATWDDRRELSRLRFARKYGSPPPVNPNIERESAAKSAERYKTISRAFDRLKAEFQSLAPDALVII